MEKIIIDGYNLLFCNDEFSKHLEEGWTVVDTITEMLQEFRVLPYKLKKKTLLVFDGNKGAYGNPREQTILGFKTIFTPPGKTADQKILELVNNAKNPKEILVVTNDNEIIKNLNSYKAQVERISSFRRRISSFKQQKNAHTKYSGNKFNPKLTKAEIEEWMDLFSE